MKILAIIPARKGSKEIPNKNIKKLGNKPLIAYTIEAALKSKYLDRIIVSTDDKKIAEIARKYKAETPFIRPKELAEDNVPLIPDVLRHAVQELKRKENFDADIVVMLQATSPLRETKYIDLAIEKLINTKCDWAVTVSKANPHPFRMRNMLKDKLKPLFNTKKIWAQRQDFPLVYHLNGSVYVTWKNVIIEKNVFQNKDWRGIVMEKEEDGLDIDTLTDFLLVETILKRRKKYEN